MTASQLVWCLHHGMVRESGKGLETETHTYTYTERGVILETRMPILLCSSAAYIGLSLTNGHAIALRTFQLQAH